MKRLIAAGILILMVAAVCVTGIFTINHHYYKIDGMLDDAISFYMDDDMEKVAEISSEIEKQWVIAERYISLFVNHSNVDEIGNSISRLEPLAITQDRQTYLAECKAIKVSLLHLREGEQLSLLNIL